MEAVEMLVYCVSLLFGLALTAQGSEVFTEELLMKPFVSGDVLAEFNFVILGANPSIKHFDLMPKVVGEFLHDHQLNELQVSLTRGVWRTGENPVHPAPTGAMVSALFNPEVLDVDRKWKQLTNALSGQFCASLNFLDAARTSTSEWSLQPIGATAGHNVTNFRHGTLPGENVCTENLTPWKKLLPCGGKRGLGSLLNSRSIHRTKYHSIGLTMRRVCPDKRPCTDPKVELKQFVSLVFDPSTFPENRNKHRSGSVKLNANNWSLRSLFGIGLNSQCPMAEKSLLFVAENPDLIQNGKKVAFDPKPHRSLDYKSETVHVYDVERMIHSGHYNLQVTYNEKFVLNRAKVKDQLVQVNRHLTGYGQEKGGIVTQLKNNGNEPLTVVLYDVLPWYLRIYFHSLKITSSLSHNRKRTLQPLRSKFTPGLDRQKPYVLELVVTLPPMSTTQISLDFELSILKWNEYPPDANKGFYIGSALVSTVLKSSQIGGLTLNPTCSTFLASFEGYDGEERVLLELFTESLLITLPTPDFSMPYNVICLACTVVALAFGPLLNLTTRSLKEEEDGEETKSKLPPKLVAFLRNIPILKKLVGGKSENKIEEEAESKKDR